MSPDSRGTTTPHIPALDLTTQGKGIEGAMQAAKDLAEPWVAEKHSRGEAIPQDAAAMRSPEVAGIVSPRT